MPSSKRPPGARRLHTVLVGAGTLATQVPMAEMTREQWQTVVDQDLNGFYNVLRATLPKLKAWGGGSYVHLGSAGHLRWPEGDVMSVAPKAAIEALITGIAREEGKHLIRANTVLLGVIEAGMFLGAHEDRASSTRTGCARSRRTSR